jgi:hypothetical protein
MNQGLRTIHDILLSSKMNFCIDRERCCSELGKKKKKDNANSVTGRGDS